MASQQARQEHNQSGHIRTNQWREIVGVVFMRFKVEHTILVGLTRPRIANTVEVPRKNDLLGICVAMTQASLTV